MTTTKTTNERDETMIVIITTDDGTVLSIINTREMRTEIEKENPGEEVSDEWVTDELIETISHDIRIHASDV